MLCQVEISKYSFDYLMYVKFEIDEKIKYFYLIQVKQFKVIQNRTTYSIEITTFAPAYYLKRGKIPLITIEKIVYGKDNKDIQGYRSKGMETTVHG